MSVSNLKLDILDCNDLEEFEYLRTISRYNFENNKIKWNSQSLQQHLSYSRFELDTTHNLERFRNILERFISKQNGTHINIYLWLQYVDMEIRYHNYNHARNLFKRSINMNTGGDMLILYLKYIEFEHLLLRDKAESSGVVGVLAIFREWRSKIYYNDIGLLNAYYKVYLKYLMLYYDKEQLDILRTVFIECFVFTSSFNIWLDYEIQNNKSIDYVRTVFNFVIDTLAAKENQDVQLIQFALKRYILYEFELDEKNRVKSLLEIYHEYEADVGVDLQLQNIINSISNVEKAKTSYMKEKAIYFEKESINKLAQIDEESYYSIASFWLDYGTFLESTYKIKEYEALLERLKPKTNKETTLKSNHLKIYLKMWLKYLSFLEKDSTASQKWTELIGIVKQYKNLKFKKVWINYLSFLFKQKNNQELWLETLTLVVLQYGKPSIFKAIISQLYVLNRFDEIRFVYKHFISYNPFFEQTWEDYVKLETMLQDGPRVRELYLIIIDLFLKINSPQEMHSSFILNSLKNFIKFETEEGEYAYVRDGIWLRYLLNEETNVTTIFFKEKLQLWIDCAYWELKSPTKAQLIQYENNEADETEIQITLTEENKNNCRSVFEKGISFFNNAYTKKLALLNQYMDFEKNYGDDPQLIAALEKRYPVNGVFIEDTVRDESNKLDSLINLIDQWEE